MLLYRMAYHRPQKRRRVPRPEKSKANLFTEKYTSHLAKPFRYGDTLIVCGKLQKLSYGVHIQLAEDRHSSNLILNLFLGSYQPPVPSDSDVTPDPEPYHSTYFLCRNDYFQIEITLVPTAFEIDINGRPYVLDVEDCLETGRYLKIGGSIAFLTQVQHRSRYPVEWPQWKSTNLVRSENYFLSDFPIPMEVGHAVILTILPYGSESGKLEICFTQNARPIPALKICADFTEPQIVTLMGMNSEEELEEEEPMDEGFPFKINRKFRIAIGFSEHSFLLAINGCRYASFQYRSLDLPASLNGYYVRTGGPLKAKIISSDHVNIHNGNCDQIELFSTIRSKFE